MDFAASEAKKRGQSFPGTAVNLRRERPGTNQPCPMRPTSAGRSGPGFVPGHRSILPGRKNFFAPAGSNSRPKAVDMPRPVTRSRDGENAPSAGQPVCGEQFARKNCGCAPPGHTQPGQRKRPSTRQATCGEQFSPKGYGYAPPGLRRGPAAQNKKGTRIGCLSAWEGWSV